MSSLIRAVGIDPGTFSFDVCGLAGDSVFLDRTIPTAALGSDGGALVDLLANAGPIDMIIGPSGYGLPWVSIQELGPDEKTVLLLSRKEDPGEDTIIAGMGQILGRLKESGLPVTIAPGVIHLPTVPAHRKVNRIDMGTADKVCAVALGLYDQARKLHIPYEETSFLYIELGGAFTAIIAVEAGTIVDGMGGTSGPLGFLASGAMDGEVAYSLGDFPKGTLGSGGVAYVADEPDASPEQLILRAGSERRCTLAWDAFEEGLVKSVASLLAVVSGPRELLVSGRLCRVPDIYRRVDAALAPYGRVRRVEGYAQVSKEAAQGAALIANGLTGGRHEGLVDAMRLREASGSALDHLYVTGSDAIRDRYLGTST